MLCTCNDALITRFIMVFCKATGRASERVSERAKSLQTCMHLKSIIMPFTLNRASGIITSKLQSVVLLFNLWWWNVWNQLSHLQSIWHAYSMLPFLSHLWWHWLDVLSKPTSMLKINFYYKFLCRGNRFFSRYFQLMHLAWLKRIAF